MTPEEMDAIGDEINLIRDSITLLLELPDETFTARALAQKQLGLASAALLDFRSKLAMRFAYDCLIRARHALEASGEDESAAITKIESCMAQLAEETV